MLMTRIQAGNSSSAHGEMPVPTSSTSAAASPATVSYLDTILVRRAIQSATSAASGVSLSDRCAAWAAH
jgi:hypothetical protein